MDLENAQIIETIAYFGSLSEEGSKLFPIKEEKIVKNVNNQQVLVVWILLKYLQLLIDLQNR